MKQKNQEKENNQIQQKGGNINLKWSCNKYLENKFELLEQNLLKKQQIVKQLTINLNESYVSENTLKRLSLILNKAQIQEILKLNFVCCKIQSYQYIQDLLQTQAYNNLNYLILNFGDVDLKNGQIEFLCKGIVNYQNLLKLKINLKGCLIQDQGVQILSNCLVQLKQLKSLDLYAQSNLLGEKAGQYLSEAASCLKELNIYKLNLCQNQAFSSNLLCYSIRNMETLKNLQEISIGIALKYTSTYDLSYELRQYYKNDEFIYKFFEQMSEFKNLKIFKIFVNSGVFKNQKICQVFNKAILSMESLQILSVNSFYVTLEGLNLALSGFQNHKSLIFLNLEMGTRSKNLTQQKALKKMKRLVMYKA